LSKKAAAVKKDREYQTHGRLKMDRQKISLHKTYGIHPIRPKPMTEWGKRRWKIDTIRQKIAKGIYDINKHIDDIFDKILEDLS
jgi:hypothetical protein